MPRCFGFLLLGLLILQPLAAPFAGAHGSVTADGDQCLIEIGYRKAHFKILLPERRGHRQYCEDLPLTGESLFVMEYQHEELSRLPLDFRIIRNVTGMGRFAVVEDLVSIADIEAATVFHQSARTSPDVFAVRHRFREAGDYLGIVTLREPETGHERVAVFPFRVGFASLGLWPYFLGLVLAVQGVYVWMNGRARRRRLVSAVLAVGLPALLLSAAPRAGEEAGDAWWVSDRDSFRVAYRSETTPIPLNRMHTWILRLQNAEGEPINGADIQVTGGMPAHDHGLPTRPSISEELDGGEYRLAGLRFHMMGEWELEIMIEADGVVDRVVLPLRL